MKTFAALALLVGALGAGAAYSCLWTCTTETPVVMEEAPGGTTAAGVTASEVSGDAAAEICDTPECPQEMCADAVEAAPAGCCPEEEKDAAPTPVAPAADGCCPTQELVAAPASDADDCCPTQEAAKE